MGRQKKNELDTVLEQLKMSYATGFNDDLEDSLLDSNDSDEDDELSSILEKIFVEENKHEDDVNISENEETVKDTENFSESSKSLPADSVTTEKNEAIDKNHPEDPIIEQTEIDMTEEKKVDDVLEIMLGGGHGKNNNVIDKNNNVINETSAEKSDKVVPDSLPVSYNDEFSDDVVEIEENKILDSVLIDVISEKEHTQAYRETLDTENKTHSEYNTMVDENDSETDAPSNNVYLEHEFIETFQSDSVFEEVVSDNVECENETQPSVEIILDTEQYISDPLQQTILDISFYKLQNDIDFSVIKAIKNEPETADTDMVENTDKGSDADNKDISLLLKFGYDGEISESGKSGHANKVIFKKSKEYLPTSYKVKHGFTGKEFCERSQVAEIKKKYKSDKLTLMIKAIIVSLIALFAVLTDFLVAFSAFDNTAPIYINSIWLLIVIVILIDKVYLGLKSLISFDANEYCLPSVILTEYFILESIAGVLRYISSEHNGYISLGGYALICISLTVWGEFLDCCREAYTFDYISKDGEMYVAERHIARSNPRVRYIVRQSEFLIGYHNKTIESKNSIASPFIVIGILPLIAAISAISNSMISGDSFSGLNAAASILLFAAPLSCALGLSAINYFDSLNLKKFNAVYIGTDASDKLEKVESLVFEDTVALEITSCIEIDPDSNSDSRKKWINIAHNIFSILGGPLSNSMPIMSKEESNIEHDIVINSMSYNGIDLHFDSSMNVLIGDRQYMLSRNIKVKTDINLTGAVKGAERSVIYMAFDKIPRIGFIVSGKIKQSFIDMVDLLNISGINAEVRSYEPEINEYFFEMNDPKHIISVEKPEVFESKEPSEVSDSNVVASSNIDICHAIVYSKKASQLRKKNKKIIIAQTLLGCVFAFVLSVLQILPIPLVMSAFLKNYSSIILYAVAVLMLIPNIIQTIKIIKRKNN